MKQRHRLFVKYAALIVALVAGVLIASGALSLYFGYGENKQALFALQREKADAAAYRIEQYVKTSVAHRGTRDQPWSGRQSACHHHAGGLALC